MNLKNLLAKIALIVLVGSSLALPLAATAAQNINGGSATYTNPSVWPTGFWGPLVWCTGNYVPNSGQPSTTPSCTNLCDLIGTFINIIYFTISVAVFIITPVSLVVGSIMVMVSGANPEMLGTGKKVLYSTVIGLAIVLGAYLLIATVIKVLGITGVGGFGTGICNISS